MFVDILKVIVVIVMAGGYIFGGVLVINFIVELPKQLKRIADALEKERKDGK